LETNNEQGENDQEYFFVEGHDVPFSIYPNANPRCRCWLVRALE
jgi:hypothetical protein